MTKRLKYKKNISEAIGTFVLAFSELEFGLDFLCSMTEQDILKRENYIVKYKGYTLDRKLKHLSDFINENLAELRPLWEELKNEIGQLNRERRFLIHGINPDCYSCGFISTIVIENGKLVSRNLTIEEIEKFTTRLQEVNSGANGINGDFQTNFTKTRINKWNNIVNENNKIIYLVNDKIISDWKGNGLSLPQKTGPLFKR